MRDLSKDDNIHIKLEISKDKDTNELVITTRFDPSSSNFSKDEYGYIWIPTAEEIKFINDAFELVPTDKIKISPPEKKPIKTTEKKEEKVETNKPQVKVEEKPEEPAPPERKIEKEPLSHTQQKEKKVETNKPQVKVEEKLEEPSPFERKTEKEPLDHIEKKEEEMRFEVTGEEQTSEKSPSKATNDADKSIIVKADEKAIEKALKKDEDENGTIKEADEQTIIDKVLSQKKKGKWSRPSS